MCRFRLFLSMAPSDVSPDMVSFVLAVTGLCVLLWWLSVEVAKWWRNRFSVARVFDTLGYCSFGWCHIG